MSIHRIMIAAVSTAFLASSAWALDSANAGAIKITQAWSRATTTSGQNGVVFMTIENSGSTGDRLIAATTPVSEKAELHTHTNDNGVMRMRPVDGINLSPGAAITLAPGGLHVMLMSVKAPLVKGKSFPLTLTFEKAGAATVDVSIQGAGDASMMAPMGMGDSMGMDHDGMHHMH